MDGGEGQVDVYHHRVVGGGGRLQVFDVVVIVQHVQVHLALQVQVCFHLMLVGMTWCHRNSYA